MSRNDRRLIALTDVSRHNDVKNAMDEALRLIRFSFRKHYGRVAIKPNLCYYWSATAGETTDPLVVGALVDLLRERSSADEIYLVESDATAMRMNHAVRILGYEKLARKKKMKLINLSRGEQLVLDRNDSIGSKISIPKIMTEMDLFISVPKLKLHPITGLTCALKNQFGCVGTPRKVTFHKDIDRVIALVNHAVTPDLVVVDGVICLGRTPRRLNLVMAASDPVAVDFVAAKIAGLNPRSVRHLVESEKLGVGTMNVELVGDDLSMFSNRFPRRGFLQDITTKLLLRVYGAYTSLLTMEGRVLKPRQGL